MYVLIIFNSNHVKKQINKIILFTTIKSLIYNYKILSYQDIHVKKERKYKTFKTFFSIKKIQI